jgi:hypothetical protein
MHCGYLQVITVCITVNHAQSVCYSYHQYFCNFYTYVFKYFWDENIILKKSLEESSRELRNIPTARAMIVSINNS